DRYFAVREEAVEALHSMGIARERIGRVPMPVRPQFAPATMGEIHRFRQEFGLSDSSTILISGGARGGGPILSIYDTVRRVAPEANILVICGRNRKLRRMIERKADPNTRTFPFVTDIHRFIAAA